MSSPSTSEQQPESRPPGGEDEESPDDESTPDDPTAAEASSAADADAATEAAGDDAESPAAEGLSLDLVFEILKNSRRREVLRFLKERRERVTLSELAEHVAAIENDTTVQALSSQQRKRVYVGLYQCHLPKLDDMDVVEFNQSRGHVELGPNAAQLDKYLYMDEDDADEERPWYQYYLGYSAVAALVLLAGAGTGVVGTTGVVALSGAVVLGIAGLAALHAAEQLD